MQNTAKRCSSVSYLGVRWLLSGARLRHDHRGVRAVGTIHENVHVGSATMEPTRREFASASLPSASSPPSSPPSSSSPSSSPSPPSTSSSSQLPLPGAPLKKATQHDMFIGGLLHRRGPSATSSAQTDVFTDAPGRNPEDSARRKAALKRTLEKYKTDLMRGKNGGDSVPSPHALPFLEDTITHLVGRERTRLKSQAGSAAVAAAEFKDGTGSPSRVRALAMAEALRGSGFYGDFGPAEAGLADSRREGTGADVPQVPSPQNRLRESYIRAANSIIGIISAVEARVLLTREEKMAVARAAAEEVDGEGRRRRQREREADGGSGDGGRGTTTGAKKRGHGSGTHAHAHTYTHPEDVLDCLQLLDLSQEAIRHIVSTYPSILFLDVDRHMLPVLAYLSDLGLDDADLAGIVSKHPSIFKPSNENALQSGVAFWTGKGLSRGSIVNLIKLDPAILETNKLVMQMKVDWLTEHTGRSVEELAAEPRMLSANLGAVTAPRIAWLVDRGEVEAGNIDLAVLSRIVGTRSDGGDGGDRDTMDVEHFLEAFASDPAAYDAFVGAWYPKEFVPWLERKSRMSEILVQQESDMFELAGMGDAGDESSSAASAAIQAFAAGKEFAWEQQMEREREWHMAWHAWKREQQSVAVAERAIKRHQQRSEESLGGGSAAGGAAEGHFTSQETTRAAGDGLSEAVPGGDTGATCLTTGGAGHQTTHAAPWSGTPNSTNATNHASNNQRSVFFLSRKWTCDSMIDEALSQAVADCEQLPDDGCPASGGAASTFDPEALSGLSVERVQSCAVNLLLLLRASEYGTLEPRVFNAWAARSGVAAPELTAAKAIVSSSGAAFVRSEPSWKYHSVPQKVWRLRDTAFFAPGLLPVRDTRGSRAVADLADLIHKSLRQNPDAPMTRLEISEMYDNKPEFQSKRMRFAIGLLLEQGMVIQRRRRGIASGPMELVLAEGYIRMNAT